MDKFAAPRQGLQCRHRGCSCRLLVSELTGESCVIYDDCILHKNLAGENGRGRGGLEGWFNGKCGFCAGIRMEGAIGGGSTYNVSVLGLPPSGVARKLFAKGGDGDEGSEFTNSVGGTSGPYMAVAGSLPQSYGTSSTNSNLESSPVAIRLGASISLGLSPVAMRLGTSEAASPENHFKTVQTRASSASRRWKNPDNTAAAARVQEMAARSQQAQRDEIWAEAKAEVTAHVEAIWKAKYEREHALRLAAEQQAADAAVAKGRAEDEVRQAHAATEQSQAAATLARQLRVTVAWSALIDRRKMDKAEAKAEAARASAAQSIAAAETARADALEARRLAKEDRQAREAAEGRAQAGWAAHAAAEKAMQEQAREVTRSQEAAAAAQEAEAVASAQAAAVEAEAAQLRGAEAVAQAAQADQQQAVATAFQEATAAANTAATKANVKTALLAANLAAARKGREDAEARLLELMATREAAEVQAAADRAAREEAEGRAALAAEREGDLVTSKILAEAEANEEALARKKAEARLEIELKRRLNLEEERNRRIDRIRTARDKEEGKMQRNVSSARGRQRQEKLKRTVSTFTAARLLRLPCKSKKPRFALQVHMDIDSISKMQCAVLDMGDKIYLYQGQSASSFDKQASTTLAHYLETSKAGAASLETANEYFWKLLNGREEDVVASLPERGEGETDDTLIPGGVAFVEEVDGTWRRAEPGAEADGLFDRAQELVAS